MGKTVRLSETEQELLRNKAIEINKLLVKKGFPPLTDSQLLHKIFDKSVAYAKITVEGEIFLELG